jgi:hypothetical protein
LRRLKKQTTLTLQLFEEICERISPMERPNESALLYALIR